MKKFLLLSFCFMALFTQAQSPISFVLADVPVAVSNNRIAIDTLPLPAVSYGNKGANQFYDFSNLVVYRYDTVEYRNPTSSQLSTCPQADAATTLDGTNFILTNTTTNKLILEGFEGQLTPGNTVSAAYSTKPDIYQLPMNYNNNFSGSFYLQKTVPGSQVGQPVSEVRLTISGTYKDTVDGWGAVKTPLGTYKCLRNKRDETTTTLIEFKLLSFSPWSTASNTTSTTTRYTYLTKETKGSAVTFDYDSLNNLRSVSWSMTPPSAPVADYIWNNPSGGLVAFTDQSDNYPTSWSWNFGDGSAVSTQQNPNHIYAANGTYNVCLTATNAGGSHTVCKNVVVSNITAANNKPVANDDFVTDTAGKVAVINVTANDVDPDGNTLCVSSVWGSPDVTVANCSSIQHSPAVGLGGTVVVYYSVCDNGTPALCDTGMVTITVLPSNNKPNAVDDALTAVQATPATFNLLTNDTDPDGNTLCITDVWGIPSVGLISGNCTSVTYLSDTCFTGTQTFWYSICDNGNPVRCDTAQATVTVTPNSAYVAVADFPNLSTSVNQYHNCNTLTLPQTSQNYNSLVWTVYDAFDNSTTNYTTDTLTYQFTSQAIQIKICLSVTNVCGTDTKCDSTQISCVGLNNVSNISANIYPNPANQQVTLDWSSSNTEIAQNASLLEIYDLMGNRVSIISLEKGSQQTTLNTSQLSNGAYLAVLVGINNYKATLGRFAVMR
ncbi:MAG: PKD domain-containing protein [Chitinophagales bacterium]|nr:PKD domain-containing protein [Chitinophagales bacterium]